MIALVLFAGSLAFGGYLLLNYLRQSGDIAAYRSAGSCPAAEALDSSSCRFDGAAKVLSVQADQLHAKISFDSLPGHSFDVGFFAGSGPPGGALSAGAATSATLWDGRVTTVAGANTTDDPESAPPNTNLVLGAFFGLIGLVGLFFSVRLACIAWQSA